MNKTVELVNEWGQFEEKHPNGSIEDFCRYYLIKEREKQNMGKMTGGKLLPPSKKILLMRIMGRITKLFISYANSAMDGLGITQFEDFNFLNTIYHLKEPRKTEVIYETINELSTGVDTLNRLKKLGYITEKNDPQDKRSKRVSLTAKGEKVLFKCYNVFGRMNDMMMKDITLDDVYLCIQLLKGVEIKYSALLQQHKGKPFEEVYREIMGDAPPEEKW